MIGFQVLALKQITNHVAYDRYLSLIQGRAAFGIIKFNGQMFTANLTNKGWDTRSWGAGYWWQVCCILCCISFWFLFLFFFELI